MKPTVGAVQEQDGVGTTQNWYQSKIQLHGVGLLGVGERLKCSMVVAVTTCRCRLSDGLLMGTHGVSLRDPVQFGGDFDLIYSPLSHMILCDHGHQIVYPSVMFSVLVVIVAFYQLWVSIYPIAERR